MINQKQNLIYIASVDSVISDIADSAKKGVEWGNSVAIYLTATLLAVSLIRYLFYRD